MSLDKIIEELKNINVYKEVCKAEIESAIDDLLNDEIYQYDENEEKLKKLTDKDINSLAWKLEDMDIWDDIYWRARELVCDELDIKNDYDFDVCDDE